MFALVIYPRRSWVYRWGDVIPLEAPAPGDVILPLKANMLATQEAMRLAQMADKWQAHPSRPIRPLPWCAALSICGHSVRCR